MNNRWRKGAACAIALCCAPMWSPAASADNAPQMKEPQPDSPSALPAAPSAPEAKALPPPRARTSVLELTLGWQTLKLSTTNTQGAADAFSLVGYTAEGAFCPTLLGCIVASTASNLNASSGGRLLTGVSLGAQAFLLGRADPAPEPDVDARSTRPPRLQSIWRVAFAGSFCQKDYDFRSLYGADDTQVFIGARPDLEGSFWCAQGALVVDYLFRVGHRVGLGVGVFRSLKTAVPGLKVQGVTAELRYQLLRF